MTDLDDLTRTRWRLVLGKFADESLQCPLQHRDRYGKMDKLLDFFYRREYKGRGVRDRSDSRQGGDEDSVLGVPDWLHQVRELFLSSPGSIIKTSRIS